MNTDYIVASLPPLRFNEPAPLSRDKFLSIVGENPLSEPERSKWRDLETQLRNAIAAARGGPEHKRVATGCSIYWRNRIDSCFRESDIAKRDEALDRVWWDAAEELTPPQAPLGKGAIATYSIRLDISLKRSLISKEVGNAAFDRLTSATKSVI